MVVGLFIAWLCAIRFLDRGHYWLQALFETSNFFYRFATKFVILIEDLFQTTEN